MDQSAQATHSVHYDIVSTERDESPGTEGMMWDKYYKSTPANCSMLVFSRPLFSQR
jgi:hypothetical protein